MPITALREIRFLRGSDHPHLVKFHEVVVGPGPERKAYLVLEYVENDLKAVLDRRVAFSLPQIKCLFHAIASGVADLHARGIIHRDLKTNNILYGKDGRARVCDLGLSKEMAQRPHTPRVQNKYYRAPEVILGCEYDEKIDVWSLGVILARLLLPRTPSLFSFGPEEEGPRLLREIYRVCGTPSEESWPEALRSELHRRAVEDHGCERSLESMLVKLKQDLDPDACDLLAKLLTLNPRRRIPACQILAHPFLTAGVRMASFEEMPRLEKEYHERMVEALPCPAQRVPKEVLSGEVSARPCKKIKKF